MTAWDKGAAMGKEQAPREDSVQDVGCWGSRLPNRGSLFLLLGSLCHLPLLQPTFRYSNGSR